MTYTEVQKRNGKLYYYRVRSIKKKGKVSKVREYLGVGLDKKRLAELEKKADEVLNESLNRLLTKREVAELKRIQQKYTKQPDANWENRYQYFLSQFTYDTNAIEGNTLSLKETSFILFEKRTPEGKSLREINEVLNHKEAFDFMLSYKGDITKNFICKIQGLVVKNTLRTDLESQTGKYRDLQVYIRGANFIPPKPKEAKKEMKNLLRWYTRNKKKLHPLILSVYFHAAFESIHPFVDGNGRAGRLLMNFILHKNTFPMVSIPNKNKLEYYDCLEQARKGNLRKFIEFLYELTASTGVYI